MSESSTGRIRRWILGAVLVASLASVVSATITDDINPMDNHVVVSLWNPAATAQVGTVSITAVQANGQTATSTVPFRLASGARTSVTASFSARVVTVEAAWITEGPDPIPQ